MMIPTNFVLMTMASLWQITSALPSPSHEITRSLIKRHQVVFQDCGKDTDEKRIKAGKAWSDAASLADFTIGGTLDDHSKTNFQGANA